MAPDPRSTASPGRESSPFPNVISLVRLACVPVFLWLLADDELLAAAALLAVLGATDWVDGWIARHFDQGSELGKVLDPIADRVLLLVAAVALIVQGSVPLVVGILVLAREAVVSVARARAGRGRRPPHRRGVGGQGGHARAHVRASRCSSGADAISGTAATSCSRAAWVIRDRRDRPRATTPRSATCPLARAALREGRVAPHAAGRSVMKAVILAGGEGTRLRPLTSNQPKPMMPIANAPMMEHIVRLLAQHGFDDIVVTVAFLANHIRNYFGDGSEFGVRMRYATEDSPLGTAGSVRNAMDELDETFLVISGDVLTDIDLGAFVEGAPRRRRVRRRSR